MNALKIREGDFDHIVDELSDNEGDEEAGLNARKEMELQEDKERIKQIITSVTEGHDAYKKLMRKNNKYSFDKLVNNNAYDNISDSKMMKKKKGTTGDDNNDDGEEEEEEMDEEEMLQRGMMDRYQREKNYKARKGGRNNNSDSDASDRDSNNPDDDDDDDHINEILGKLLMNCKKIYVIELYMFQRYDNSSIISNNKL